MRKTNTKELRRFRIENRGYIVYNEEKRQGESV